MQFTRQSGSPTTNTAKGPFASKCARRIMLAVWLACSLVAAYVAITGFRIDNSVGVWFAEDDAALEEYRQYLSDFGDREWMLVALEWRESVQGASRSDRDAVVSRLEQMEHVHWVMSSRDFREASDVVRKFLQPDPSSSHEALLLHITNDIDRQDGYREALLSKIRNLQAEFPAVESVQIAGTAVINGELNRSARRDMLLFFPAVALFVTLLGWLVFRNFRDTSVLLAVSLSTVVMTEGLLVGVGYPLNMITIMLPTVLVALSVADVVHLIHAFHARRSGTENGVAAATQAVKAIALPCAGTTLTTIAGFLAFSGSSVLPVFQLSVFASFGIALAWVLTVSGAPVLLAALWSGTTRDDPRSNLLGVRVLRWWFRVVERRQRSIVVAFAVGGVVLLGLPALEADTDYVKFFRSGSRVPREYELLQRLGFPQNPLNLVFRVPPGESPTSRKYWTPLESLVGEIENLPGVQSVLSPFVMADLARVRCEYAETLGGMLSKQRDQIQVIAMMDYPSSKRLFAILPSIRALADSVLPSDVKMAYTGTSYLWARMDDGVIETQRESLAIVCIVCFVILIIMFRSFGFAALGLVLSLFPVAMVLGLMGLLGIPVNLATVLIAGVAVGLAVDDTIHLVHSFQASRRRGLDRRDACRESIVEVGLRMVITSLILIGSFASMGLSNFLPTSQFGLLSSLTIMLALVTDLTLLPVFLAGRGVAARRSSVELRSNRSNVAEPMLPRRSACVRQS